MAARNRPVVIQASCADSGTGKVKFHVVEENGPLRWDSVCGGTVLMSYNTIPAHTVPRSDRCQKSLCQRKFYAADEAAKASADVREDGNGT